MKIEIELKGGTNNMEYHSLWYKEVPKMSRKEKWSLLLGVPAGLAAFFTLLHFTGKHLDHVNQLDDVAGRAVYAQLTTAADVDRDGSLSEMEKKLLCARMDQFMKTGSSSTPVEYARWSYCMEHPPRFFGGEVRRRAEGALKLYEEDKN